MKKRIYHYEIDLIPDWLNRLKNIISRYQNCSIVRQLTTINDYTYIGLEPKEYIYSDERYLNIVNRSQYLNKKGDYLRYLVDWLGKNQIEYSSKVAPFMGGAIGFIHDTLYDYYKGEEVTNEIPHICFMVFDELIIIDHIRSKVIFTFIGDYNKESFFNNKFVNKKKLFEEQPIIKAENVVLKINKLDLSKKFDKINFKFEKDRFFIIKVSECISIVNKVNSFDLFQSLYKDETYKQISYFKTSDFTTISFSKDDYIEFQRDQLKVSSYSENQAIDHDLLFNQINRLTNIKVDKITNAKSKIIFTITSSISLYDLLHNFKINEHNFGIPFERNRNFIRRYENEYRFTGLIGYLGYNGNGFLIDIKNNFINDKDKSYLNFVCNFNNHMTNDDYVKKVDLHVSHIMDIFES